MTALCPLLPVGNVSFLVANKSDGVSLADRCTHLTKVGERLHGRCNIPMQKKHSSEREREQRHPSPDEIKGLVHAQRSTGLPEYVSCDEERREDKHVNRYADDEFNPRISNLIFGRGRIKN